MLPIARWRRLVLLPICVVANIVVGVVTLSILRSLTQLSDADGGQLSRTTQRSHDVSASSVAGLATAGLGTEPRSWIGRRSKHEEMSYGFVFEPADAVQGRYCGTDQTLLIVVCSAVENVDRRKAIRSTWGDASLLSVLGARLVFFVARTDAARSPPGIEQHVVSEYRDQGDVVQVDFIDDYVNLTGKTLAGLRWSTRACPGVQYVMKSDDDVYIDVKALTTRLEAERSTQMSTFSLDDVAATSFIIGHVVDSARPVRDRRSKWYTPTSIYPGEFYPPYASGTGYAVGASVVSRLMTVLDAQTTYGTATSYPFWLEDIFVTGMLAASLPDVRLVHDGRFNFRLTQQRRRLPVDSWRQQQDDEACLYRDAITVHDLTPSELVNLWKRLQLSDDCNVDQLRQQLDSNDEEELYSDAV